MYGVVTSGAPYLLILELCSHGELKSYLQSGDPDDEDHYALGRLFHFLVGIAEGMNHLIQCGYVCVGVPCGFAGERGQYGIERLARIMPNSSNSLLSLSLFVSSPCVSMHACARTGTCIVIWPPETFSLVTILKPKFAISDWDVRRPTKRTTTKLTTPTCLSRFDGQTRMCWGLVGFQSTRTCGPMVSPPWRFSRVVRRRTVGGSIRL